MPNQTNQPHRILIAESDPDLRALLSQYLQAEGYATEQAASLEETFAKLAEQPVDLLVMDPFATSSEEGLAAAKRLLQQCAPTPVGIITGWPILPEEAEQAGFAFLVPKPFSLEELMQQVTTHLTQPPGPPTV